MKISSECFLDKELISIIETKKNSGFCDVLGRDCKYVYDTVNDYELVDLIIDFLSIFKVANDNIPVSNRFKLHDELLNNWSIFAPCCNEKAITVMKSIVTGSLYSRSFNVDLRIFEDDVFIPELLDNTYLEKYSILFGKDWSSFSETIKYVNRYHNNYIKLDILWHLLSYLQKTFYKGEAFYRARLLKNSQNFNESDLRIPPYEYRRPGRIGAAGVPCFYLANDEETAICEIRAGIHDWVAIGEFVCEKDLSVIDLREIDHISPFVLLDDVILYRVNKQILDNIKREIEKPLRSSENDIDYVPIQYICDYIRSQKIDGIVYRSTMRKNGFNLSLFDDIYFKLKQITNYSIAKIDYEYTKITVCDK